MKKKLIAITLAAVFLALGSSGDGDAANEQKAANFSKAKEFRIERGMSPAAQACIECHKTESPAIFVDWSQSMHARANITCLDCHQAEFTDTDVSQEHFKQYERADTPWGKAEYRTPISTEVSPKDCSRCHPDEVKQFDKSKHAHTLEIIWKIDPWLNQGLNSDVERVTGCYHCHGTILKMVDGKLDPLTWANVGIGRVNPDGSFGSCSSCHTRHRFSIMGARKPEACGQCHLGPDHPQIEIYKESKHGDIYDAFGQTYNWEAAPGTWTPGVDYRGPTCASCHMSGAGKVLTSHNVGERLSWELQAPLTIRPSEFKPFPSPTNWEVERNKMKDICLQCHAPAWVNDHYVKLDKVVTAYNE
ncbi:MAG: multiheme c-type cytochrome, partial [Desulfosarcinaceae bacterium]